MRLRLLDGLDEIRQEHENEIIAAFEQDAAIQNELSEYVGCEEDTYGEMMAELFFVFSNDWLIQHGYAFFDSVQGVLPIKWKEIPRDQWGEVPDPTLIDI